MVIIGIYTVLYSDSVTAAVKLAWFKLYYPAEFYAAALSEFIYDIELDTIMSGKEAVRRRIDTLREKKDKTVREQRILDTLPLISELMFRGIEIINTDIPRARSCTVADDKIKFTP